jgi:hypothetical protein
MNTKKTTTENKKSLNDLKNEVIDGTLVLGGGANTGGFSTVEDSIEDIRLEGNGSGTKNASHQASAKPQLL